MVKMLFIFLFIGLMCICSFRFYHRTDDITNSDKRVDVESVNLTEEVSQADPPDPQDPCGCCRRALDKIRAKRKELEMWARQMMAEHGYEEGMKRVMARSPTLAKRVQALLQKEKRDQIRAEGSSP